MNRYMEMQDLSRQSKHIILLDTNFLMLPTALGIDIYEDIPLLCDFPVLLTYIDRSLHELDMILKDKKLKVRKQARLSKEILSLKDLPEINTSHLPARMEVDDVLLDVAAEINAQQTVPCFIATNDYELKQRAKDKNIPLITVRKKQYLILENYSKI